MFIVSKTFLVPLSPIVARRVFCFVAYLFKLGMLLYIERVCPVPEVEPNDDLYIPFWAL